MEVVIAAEQKVAAELDGGDLEPVKLGRQLNMLCLAGLILFSILASFNGHLRLQGLDLFPDIPDGLQVLVKIDRDANHPKPVRPGLSLVCKVPIQDTDDS